MFGSLFSFVARQPQQDLNATFDGLEADGYYCGDDAAAKSAVAPLITAAGLRPFDAGPLRNARYLEAMAMALPLVSTSLGCEGLEVEHGKHLMVADEPAEFADRVVELLRDRERTRERISRSTCTNAEDSAELACRMSCDAERTSSSKAACTT